MRVSILIHYCKETCYVKNPEKVYNFQSIFTTLKWQYRPNPIRDSELNVLSPYCFRFSRQIDFYSVIERYS